VIEDDRSFCDAALPRVSRTFALSIQALPASLREAVGTAYLLCRLVDTIEDDPKIRGARAELFDAFDAALAGGSVEALEARAREKNLGPTDAERELASKAGAVLRVFRALPGAQQAAITPHVAEMSRGMREYAARADASASGLRLRDLADLERYCYFVAGTVGGLLTSLFLPTIGGAAALACDGEAWLREQAKSFGLGLQLVNIAKDVASDLERGDCFLPEALADAHGVPLDRVLDPAYRPRALAMLRRLCAVAREHLERAAAYTLAWPGRGGEAVRLFCAVPLALAFATLREVEEGRDSLVRGRAPTVSHALVRAVFAAAVEGAGDDAALVTLFERCRLGTLARTARPPEPPLPPAHASRIEIMQDDQDTTGRARAERRFEGKVFVTGAAGHVGANLVHRLLGDGRDVRVLLREGDDAAAIDALEAATGRRVDRVIGDLRDAELVRRAVAGCETAFHVAAKISTLGGDPEELRDLYACNVTGTANMLRAAREAKLARVVVTGSFSAVGYDPREPSKPSNEAMPFYPFDEHLPYGRTKVLVEHEALKACAEGLDIVIATSCAVLGPWDFVPSRMGKTLVDYAHGRLRAYVGGGFEFVAAKDLVAGHLLAMNRGRAGQKYIFSTEFATVDDLMDIFEEASGRPRPRLRLPGPLMAGLAEVSSFVLSNFFPDTPQRFTPGAVRILRQQRRADITKAKSELGYEPTSIRAAIHEAYDHFARRGLVPQSPSLRAQGGAAAPAEKNKPNAKEAAA
jgi:nucleoside-diphosphate-sugar epimerase/phytoene/squalene synthetase